MLKQWAFEKFFEQTILLLFLPIYWVNIASFFLLSYFLFVALAE